MPVDSTHVDYDQNVTAWLRARDVFAGEDAVKAAGVRYLPRLDSQTDDEYAAYKARATFFNATARTADGFVGLIFHREPTVKVADVVSGVGRALATFGEDADMLGTTLTAYAKNVVCEVIGVGRAGSLVDWEGEVEQRAYAVLYTAEQIINWRVERVNGRNILSLLVLKECGIDPNEVRKLAQEKRKLEEAQQVKAGEVEKVIEARLKSVRAEWDKQHGVVVDIIVHTEFEKYAIERTAELSTFGQCGIIEMAPELKKVAVSFADRILMRMAV